MREALPCSHQCLPAKSRTCTTPLPLHRRRPSWRLRLRCARRSSDLRQDHLVAPAATRRRARLPLPPGLDSSDQGGLCDPLQAKRSDDGKEIEIEIEMEAEEVRCVGQTGAAAAAHPATLLNLPRALPMPARPTNVCRTARRRARSWSTRCPCEPASWAHPLPASPSASPQRLSGTAGRRSCHAHWQPLRGLIT